ncbi:hypothetical protein ACFQX7_31675 [Luedemannella flava]
MTSRTTRYSNVAPDESSNGRAATHRGSSWYARSASSDGNHTT